uniref:GLTSCR1 domain-containing protein n=1 Tax=Strongyloides stercoralis TaxID=6248 RepID=A0A0K0EPL1_STRER
MKKSFPYLNVVSGVKNEPSSSQNMNLLQIQDNLSILANNPNLQSTSSNPSSSNLINSFSIASGGLQPNLRPNINLNYTNSFENLGNINSIVQLNSSIPQNIYQQQPSNTSNLINHDININQSQSKYPNLKSFLSTNNSLNLNSNFQRSLPQTNNFNENSTLPSVGINSNLPTLHPLIPVPHFTLESFNKVNLNLSFSEEKNGYDLPFNDITSLRFFYNYGIQQFQNLLNKQQIVKNTENSSQQLIPVIQQNPLNENPFINNSEFSIFPGTSNNITTPTTLNNINLSTNISRNNISLDSQNKSTIDLDSITKLLQHQQTLPQESHNLLQKTNSTFSGHSLQLKNQQNLILESSNVIQSPQVNLNDLLNNTNPSFSQIPIIDQQKLSIPILEKLTNTSINNINKQIGGPSNLINNISGGINQPIDLNKIKKEIDDHKSGGEGKVLPKEEPLENDPSKVCLPKLKLFTKPVPFNPPEMGKKNNTNMEFNYLLNKTKGDVHEFTKKIPICISKKVFNIVKILNSGGEKECTSNGNEDYGNILENFEDMVTYQEGLLNVNKNNFLNLKILNHRILRRINRNDIGNCNSSHLEKEKINNYLPIEVVDGEMSTSCKRRRESSSERMHLNSNMGESRNNLLIKDQFIENNKVKRFKITIPENDESSLDDLNEKYFITKENDGTNSNINNQLTIEKLGRKVLEEEDKIVNGLPKELNSLNNKKDTSINIGDCIISPLIENYLSYFKNELFYQLKKKKAKNNVNCATITSNNVSNNKSIESMIINLKPNELNEIIRKVSSTSSIQSGLNNKKSINSLENIVESIVKNSTSLGSRQNLSNYPDLPNNNLNIPQSYTLPLKISTSTNDDNNLQRQIFSNTEIQRTAELEELLNKTFTT